MDVMEANGIRHVELRGAWGLNVMKLTDAQCAELKKQFTDRGFGVSCIASPIGKVRIDEDYRKHFDLFKRAVDPGRDVRLALHPDFQLLPAGGRSHRPVSRYGDRSAE